MTTKPEVVSYVIERTKQLWRIDRELLVNEVKEEFNSILSERTIYNILKWFKKTEPKSSKHIPRWVNDLHDFLNDKWITVKDLNKFFYHQETKDPSLHEVNILWAEEVFKVWVVSDTHLWAKACALAELNDFYDICKAEWITDIFHAWDLCDWWGKVYPWQLWELVVYWFDDMLEYLKDNYPRREWIITHFILGNHDEDFLKHWWANIWKALAWVRDDLNYLWFYDANINVNGIKFWLHHWWWWASYAQSYKLQKAVETLTGDMKPQVYILWHYHGSLYMSMRNIHCFLPWCFQKSNNFSVRFNLPNIVWWYILEIHKTSNNDVRKVKPEFVQYYF